MRSVILGTAGHIDHGKTALVGALTGVDTDRLKEEKARGITIELGFAEFVVGDDFRFGVVDVPGHEAFVRAMVAGAAGMDVVLLVVAGDEGVMPQTREHLAIVDLLAVPELVVALTKCDAADDEWLELVEAEVEEVVGETRYAGASIVRTSAHTGDGLEELTEVLVGAGTRARKASEDDLVRLPLDRVFTIQGTGTVVTGSLWSGTLSKGDRVRVVPGDHEGRVRSLQVHGREAERAVAGDRTAAALIGDGGDRELVARGGVLVTDEAWEPTWMLTCRVSMLPTTPWLIEHNQRVHVHHGTAEVLARVALLEDGALSAGGEGWVQLRLETPLVARARDRVVLRSYSPVTTIGGGVVVEPNPPKRNRLSEQERGLLDRVSSDEPVESVVAALEIAGWYGVEARRLPLVTGHPELVIGPAVESLAAAGGVSVGGRSFAASVAHEAAERLLEAVRQAHAADPLRPEAPLAAVRAGLPSWAPGELADGVIGRLVEQGRLDQVEGGVRLPDFRPDPDEDQRQALASLLNRYREAGLAAPSIEELPEDVRARPDFRSLMRHLEAEKHLRAVADGLFVATEALDAAERDVVAELGGRNGLSPGDFRDVLEVTRKHLIPLLTHFDQRGVTIRDEGGRSVPTP